MSAGHLAYFEKAGEYNRLVLAFLDEQLPGGTTRVPAASVGDRGQP